MGHCGRTGYRPLEADFVGPPELTHFSYYGECCRGGVPPCHVVRHLPRGIWDISIISFFKGLLLIFWVLFIFSCKSNLLTCVSLHTMCVPTS